MTFDSSHSFSRMTDRRSKIVAFAIATSLIFTDLIHSYDAVTFLLLNNDDSLYLSIESLVSDYSLLSHIVKIFDYLIITLISY